MAQFYKYDAIQSHEKGDFHIHHISKASGYSLEVEIEQILDAIFPNKKINNLEFNEQELTYLLEIIQSLKQEWSSQIKFNIKIQDQQSWLNLLLKLNSKMILKEELMKKILINISFENLDQIPDKKLGLNERDIKILIDSPITPIFLLNQDFWKNNINEIFELSSFYGIPSYSSSIKYEELGYNLNNYKFNTGLITLNLPRIAKKTKNEDEFYGEVENLINLVSTAFDSKNSELLSYTASNHLPLTKKLFGMPIKNSFSLGIIGLHETVKKLIGNGIETNSGKAVGYKILEFIKNISNEVGVEKDYKIGLWATPINSVSNRLAKLDQELFSEPNKENKISFYSASSELPLGHSDDLWDVLEHQKKLISFYEFNPYFNIILKERIPELEGCKRLIEKIESVFKIPLFTISPIFSWCKEHGYFIGEQQKCTVCNKNNEIYLKVNRVIRKKSSLNEFELEVYKQCKPYDVAKGV